MKYTPGSLESEGHVVLTGHAVGQVTLQDGTTYDVTAPAIEVAGLDHAEEVAHLCGLQVEKHDLHPLHDANGKKGAKVPFVYTPPKKFASYKPHPDNGLEG